MQLFIPTKPTSKGNSKVIARRGYGRTLIGSRAARIAQAELIALARPFRPLRPLEGPLRLDVVAVLPIPTSWSQKERAEALAGVILPACRPDRGNLLKMLEDCLQLAGYYRDDAQLVAGEVAKRYGDPIGYRITLESIEGARSAAAWARRARRRTAAA